MSYSYQYLENASYRAIVLALCNIIDGVMVDVGPQQPGTQSLTSPLYERGWQGLNIEPVEQYLAYLNAVRPQDINLRCVVGPTEGQVGFCDFGPAGYELASFEGQPGCVSLPQTRLDTLINKQGWTDVHLLRVCTPGRTLATLGSLDWARHPVWVVVVEWINAESGMTEDLNGLDIWASQHQYQLATDQPGCRVYVSARQRHLLAPLQALTDERLPMPPIPAKQIEQDEIKAIKLAEAQRLAAEQEALRQAALQRPVWLKVKLAFAEGRVKAAVKARIKKELSKTIRAVLRHEAGRKVAYFLTAHSPHTQTRLRYMSPQPKPLYSDQVNALLKAFEANVPLASNPTDLKV